jgi:hypothetical protein
MGWTAIAMIILLISHDKIVRPSGEADPNRRVRRGQVLTFDAVRLKQVHRQLPDNYRRRF